jgi:HSP20 family protein
MFKLKPWAARWRPVRREENYTLENEVNKPFDDSLGGRILEPYAESPSQFREKALGDLTPRIDVSETEKELVVKVELPGLTEKDVGISITRDMLTISGEKRQEMEQREKGWYRMERQYGSFNRSLPLPYEIEPAKAEAMFQNGVLSIKLPKSAAQQKGNRAIPTKAK